MELTEKLDIKVFILFLLKNMREPLEYSTINDIVIQDGFVNYFDFSICFGELVESGQIEEIPGGKSTYRISKDGETAVENVEMRLFTSVREKALRSALRLLAFYKTGNRITSSVTEKDGGFVLNCSIIDNTRKLLDINVFLTEKYYAETLKGNYEDRAENIYKGVLALLSGDVNYIFDE
ncbi:MAG: DUF4364 family protein [Clostridia bacterium]|nr:DUF4364 family protein [Clostridia bacterium]